MRRSARSAEISRVADLNEQLRAFVGLHPQSITADDLDLSEIPLLGEDRAFLVWERTREAAIAEYEAATDPEARYEAVSMVSWLHEQQMVQLREALAQASELSTGDQARFKRYSEAWVAEAQAKTIVLMDKQNDLVDELGRERCQQVIDDRAKPRLEAVKQELVRELQDDLEQRRRGAGLPAEAVVAATKACPDCAEEIKAAARVCRFCGYRFGEPGA